MKRISKSVLVALPLALAVATITIAASESDSQSHGGHRIQWLQQKLGLTDDQVQSVQAAFAADADAKRDLHQKLGQAMADFRQTALNGADASTLAAKKSAALDLMGQELDLRAKDLGQLGKILTPDQRSAFAAMKGGFRHGRWHHHSSSDQTDSGA
jgi:Spy/CpxP family protein refolding chaperone